MSLTITLSYLTNALLLISGVVFSGIVAGYSAAMFFFG